MERSRSQLACADLVGRKVGDKYFGHSLLPPCHPMPGLPLARKRMSCRAALDGQRKMPSAPAIWNGESRFRLGAYYEGFPLPRQDRRCWKTALVSARPRPLLSTRAPRQESFLLFRSCVSCLHFGQDAIFKCLALWICILEGKRGDSTQSRAGWAGGGGAAFVLL